jgi:hypothetical protein
MQKRCQLGRECRFKKIKINNINYLEISKAQKKPPLAAQVAVFCRYLLPLCQESGRLPLDRGWGVSS